MAESVAYVRHRIVSDAQPFLIQDASVQVGDRVVIETEHGPSLGTVIKLDEGEFAEASPLRIATQEDLSTFATHTTREQEAFAFAKQLIKEQELSLKLVSTEVPLSGSRIVFYFTSDDRVDFRTLVRDLAKRFHTRIEMRQIGIRDASRYLGGQATCGRSLCCSTFLPEFHSISIRMAKDQTLALNLDALSGVCGRLKCCLKYEHEQYKESKKGLPKLGRRVETPDGTGRVVDLNVLLRQVSVSFKDGRIRIYDASSVRNPNAPPANA